MKKTTPLVISTLSLLLLLQGIACGEKVKSGDSQKPSALRSFEPPPEEEYSRSPSEVLLAKINGYSILGGITLPPGYEFVEIRGGFCSLMGGISGPNGFKISYSVWIPAPAPGQPRHSGHYTSHVKANFPKEYKARYINGELIEMMVINKKGLLVDIPNRALNLSANVKNEEQLADALLIISSITNKTRDLSWDNAKIILEHAEIESVQQSRDLTVNILTTSGISYRTRQPKINAVVDTLKSCKKYNKETMIETIIFEQKPDQFDDQGEEPLPPAAE